eukprot:7697733-Alexandrium_andersonii.AAC.1
MLVGTQPKDKHERQGALAMCRGSFGRPSSLVCRLSLELLRMSDREESSCLLYTSPSPRD